MLLLLWASARRRGSGKVVFCPGFSAKGPFLAKQVARPVARAVPEQRGFVSEDCPLGTPPDFIATAECPGPMRFLAPNPPPPSDVFGRPYTVGGAPPPPGPHPH